MKLPPVDEFRALFVEPLGHLTMQAAYADDQLILLCAWLSGCDGPTISRKLQNWGPQAKATAAALLGKIEGQRLREEALSALERYDSLRIKRNRAIHDAIHLGIYGDDDSGYCVEALAARSNARQGQDKLSPITPGQIAEVACDLYEVHKDLEFVVVSLSSERD